ncbi:MAG: competence/damage-inducible protein A [Rickettsiaceae bacterium]|nr:competence/damage-inducible protein A [Rickettsiaceae bacterium]
MAIIRAAIIIIGNEILSGKVQDKNVNKIINILTEEKNILVEEVIFIKDNRQEIINKVSTLSKKYDYVFTTGGIGPTHDDITSEAVSSALNVDFIVNEDILARLTKYYNSNSQELNDARIKMACVPRDATLLYCDKATAPGFKIKNVIVVAGIPNIMEAMLMAALPLLNEGDKFYNKAIEIFATETNIAAELELLQKKYSDVEIGSYPFYDREVLGTLVTINSYNAQHLNIVYTELEKIAAIHN